MIILNIFNANQVYILLMKYPMELKVLNGIAAMADISSDYGMIIKINVTFFIFLRTLMNGMNFLEKIFGYWY
jgi:hypothetical protein